MFYHVLPHLCHWFSQPPTTPTTPTISGSPKQRGRTEPPSQRRLLELPQWRRQQRRRRHAERLGRRGVRRQKMGHWLGAWWMMWMRRVVVEKKIGKTIGNHRKKMEMTMSMSLFVRILQLIYHLLLNLEADGPSWWPWCVYLETFASDLPWESRIPGAEWCHDRRHRSP